VNYDFDLYLLRSELSTEEKPEGPHSSRAGDGIHACLQEAVKYRLDITEFDRFVEDVMFSGIRAGSLPNTGEEYSVHVDPVWPRLTDTGVAGTENDNAFVFDYFTVSISTRHASYAKAYSILHLSSQALRRVRATNGSTLLHTSSCRRVRYIVTASPKPIPAVPICGNATSRILIDEPPRRLRTFEQRPSPFSLAAETDYSVYMHKRLLRKMREAARRHDDREVAFFLVGKIFQDAPRSTQLYAVIEDAIDAKCSSADLFQITITGETWNAFWSEMKLRSPDAELLGLLHSHPFPSDSIGDDVENPYSVPLKSSEVNTFCPPRGERTTVFLSDDDFFILDTFFAAPQHIACVVDPHASIGNDIGIWGWRDGSITSRMLHVIE